MRFFLIFLFVFCLTFFTSPKASVSKPTEPYNPTHTSVPAGNEKPTNPHRFPPKESYILENLLSTDSLEVSAKVFLFDLDNPTTPNPMVHLYLKNKSKEVIELKTLQMDSSLYKLENTSFPLLIKPQTQLQLQLQTISLRDITKEKRLVFIQWSQGVNQAQESTFPLPPTEILSSQLICTLASSPSRLVTFIGFVIETPSLQSSRTFMIDCQNQSTFSVYTRQKEGAKLVGRDTDVFTVKANTEEILDPGQSNEYQITFAPKPSNKLGTILVASLQIPNAPMIQLIGTRISKNTTFFLQEHVLQMKNIQNITNTHQLILNLELPTQTLYLYPGKDALYLEDKHKQTQVCTKNEECFSLRHFYFPKISDIQQISIIPTYLLDSTVYSNYSDAKNLVENKVKQAYPTLQVEYVVEPYPQNPYFSSVSLEKQDQLSFIPKPSFVSRFDDSSPYFSLSLGSLLGPNWNHMIFLSGQEESIHLSAGFSLDASLMLSCKTGVRVGLLSTSCFGLRVNLDFLFSSAMSQSFLLEPGMQFAGQTQLLTPSMRTPLTLDYGVGFGVRNYINNHEYVKNDISITSKLLLGVPLIKKHLEFFTGISTSIGLGILHTAPLIQVSFPLGFRWRVSSL